MAGDVSVVFIDHTITLYPKVDFITEGPHALRLEVKRYPGLEYRDPERKHVASIPYTAIQSWTEETA